MLETRIKKERYIDIDNSPKVEVNETTHFNFRGRLAINMIERWGMVQGIEDGEDSAGRAKLRLATPAELVSRAMEVADLLHDRMLEKDWIHEGPTFFDLDTWAEEDRREKTEEPVE